MKLAVMLIVAGICGPHAHTQARPHDTHSARRIEVTKEEATKHLKKIVDPAYPRIAIERGLEGTILFRVLISERGDVINARPLQQHPAILVRAALDALKQWKYEPFTMNGESVPVRTTVEVLFRLRER